MSIRQLVVLVLQLELEELVEEVSVVETFSEVVMALDAKGNL